MFQLLRSLIVPTNPSDKTFPELMEVLKTHFNPEPLEIVERHKFNIRIRRTGESVATYLLELWVLFVNCKFGPVLDDMLWHRLICGINDDKMQKRLLSEPRFTLEKATKVAYSMESKVQNVHQLQSVQPMQESRERVYKMGLSSLHTRQQKSKVSNYMLSVREDRAPECKVQTQSCKVPQLW